MCFERDAGPLWVWLWSVMGNYALIFCTTSLPGLCSLPSPLDHPHGYHGRPPWKDIIKLSLMVIGGWVRLCSFFGLFVLL